MSSVKDIVDVLLGESKWLRVGDLPKILLPALQYFVNGDWSVIGDLNYLLSSQGTILSVGKVGGKEEVFNIWVQVFNTDTYEPITSEEKELNYNSVFGNDWLSFRVGVSSDGLGKLGINFGLKTPTQVAEYIRDIIDKYYKGGNDFDNEPEITPSPKSFVPQLVPSLVGVS